jgi:hypothetical protein
LIKNFMNSSGERTAKKEAREEKKNYLIAKIKGV